MNGEAIISIKINNNKKQDSIFLLSFVFFSPPSGKLQ